MPASRSPSASPSSPRYRVAPEKLYAFEAENQAANDAILNMIVVVRGVVVAIGMVGLVNAITMSITGPPARRPFEERLGRVVVIP